MEHRCNSCFSFLSFLNIVISAPRPWMESERHRWCSSSIFQAGRRTGSTWAPRKQARQSRRNSPVCSTDVFVCIAAIQREYLSVTQGDGQVEMRTQRETDPRDAASTSLLAPGREKWIIESRCCSSWRNLCEQGWCEKQRQKCTAPQQNDKVFIRVKFTQRQTQKIICSVALCTRCSFAPPMSWAWKHHARRQADMEM